MLMGFVILNVFEHLIYNKESNENSCFLSDLYNVPQLLARLDPTNFCYILFHNFYTYVPKMKNLVFITFCSLQAFHAGIMQFKDVCNLKQQFNVLYNS